MNEQFPQTIAVNFRFFRRNRLLAGILGLMLVVLSIQAIQGFFEVGGNRLAMARMISSVLNGFSMVAIAGAALLLLSGHLRNHSIRLVFTKPFPPEQWLLCALVSTAILGACLFAFAALVSEAMLLAGHMPFQWGIVLIELNEFSNAMVVASVISLLAVIFHPVIAASVFLIFNEGTFGMLAVFFTSLAKWLGKGNAHNLFLALREAAAALYYTLPTYEPFRRHMHGLYSSFAVTGNGLLQVLFSVCYSAVAFCFFYLLSVLALKRKRQI